MCGIAGVVIWDERFRVGRQTLEAMSARIAHRGPDGQGIHVNHESEISPGRPRVLLAHRRLAILDPDPRADQPFSDGHGRWLVFNGEIYNFRELRIELAKLKPDYAWRTQGDTEVLLLAYDVWGEKCLERLNGMFAFAVWDEPGKALFLARDRMGQKPLYLCAPSGASHPSAIAFASELDALRVIPWFDDGLCGPALAEYLRRGYVGNEATIYRSAEKLALGTWRRFGPKAVAGARYFCPNEADAAVADPVSATRQRVLMAVRRQLVSDVPLGCFLSGGVDSSVVAAAARSALDGRRLRTFSIGFEDPRYDESTYAQRVARHLGTEHLCFHVRPDAAADLPRLARRFGEPFGDSSALPTHYLSRETRQHVKVALSGDGGDELFGGYDRYRALFLGRHLQRVPRPLQAALARPWAQRLPGVHPKSTGARVKRFLRTLSHSGAARYASYMRLFDDATIGRLCIEAPAPAPDVVEEIFESLSASREPVPAALATDRITYLPDDLLTKVDRCSMLHALEVRSPLMDHELVRLAAGLSTDQLLRGGPKRMLRQAFAGDLPAWVFKRRKMGFAAPVGEWFRDELRPMLHDCLFAARSFATENFHLPVVRQLIDEHERRRVDHSQRLYALLMLELWRQNSRS